jgi:hypothetical protein
VAPASAVTLRYTMTGVDTDGIVEFAQFDIDSNAVPDDFELGAEFAFFDLPGIYTYGNFTIDLDDMYFYHADFGGGIFGQSGITATNGLQLYTGSEDASTLLTGTFVLTDYYDGAPLMLTVTAVPEPMTWALMIGGFAMTGAVLRRRRVHAVLV